MMYQFSKNCFHEFQSFCSVIIGTAKLKADDIPDTVLPSEFLNLE